jgi:hypothetical protein
LYHEKRIALVNNFVCLLPLKNIVQGRKGYLKAEKKNPWESSFPLFYLSRDRKVEKKFHRVFSFPHSNILFFPGQYFSEGSRKSIIFTIEILYFIIQKRFCGNSALKLASKQPHTVFYTSKNCLFVSPKNSNVIFVIFRNTNFSSFCKNSASKLASKQSFTHPKIAYFCL